MIKRTYSKLATDTESLMRQTARGSESPDFHKKRRAAPWSSTNAMPMSLVSAPTLRALLCGLLLVGVCLGAASSRASLSLGGISVSGAAAALESISLLGGAHNILCDGRSRAWHTLLKLLATS